MESLDEMALVGRLDAETVESLRAFVRGDTEGVATGDPLEHEPV